MDEHADLLDDMHRRERTLELRLEICVVRLTGVEKKDIRYKRLDGSLCSVTNTSLFVGVYLAILPLHKLYYVLGMI